MTRVANSSLFEDAGAYFSQYFSISVVMPRLFRRIVSPRLFRRPVPAGPTIPDWLRETPALPFQHVNRSFVEKPSSREIVRSEIVLLS
jgi:hypothetical protein